MRTKTLFDLLTTLAIIIITIDALLRWHDRALAWRMRDIERLPVDEASEIPLDALEVDP
jgi:hypothetical protein